MPTPQPATRRRVGTLWLLLFALAALVSGSVRAATTDVIFPGEKRRWRHVKSPHFELYASGSSDRDARDLLHRLELLHAVFFEHLRLVERRPLPVTVFDFGSDDEYKAYAHAHSSGIQATSLDRAYLLIRHRAFGQALPTVSHEYIHFLFTVAAESKAAWYGEGMADLFSTIDVEGDDVLIGKASDARVLAMRRVDMLPLETLFAIGLNSPHYGAGDHISAFYAQSWAVLHYLRFGNSELPRDGINNFLDIAGDLKASGDAPKVRQACKDFLGIDYPELSVRIQAYANAGLYRMMRMPSPKLADPKGYEIRNVSREEARLRLAELSLRLKRDAVARIALQGASEKPGAEARVFEVLATDARIERKQELAEELWQKALAAGSTNPGTYRDMVMLEARKMFTRFDYDFRVTGEAASRLRTLIDRCLELGPQQNIAYETMAMVEAFAPEPDLSNVKRVKDHFLLLKDKPKVLLALAIVCGRFGEKEAAFQLLDEIPNHSPMPAQLSQAKYVRTRIEGPTIPPGVLALNNADVAWTRTEAGLEPRLLRNAVRVLTSYNDEHMRGRTLLRDALFKLLEDPQRFVLAHVLLSQGAQAQPPVRDGALWNGLRVELLPDGSTRIDPAQRVALRERWHRDLGLANAPRRMVEPRSRIE